jgi:hypothetical protein
MKATKENKEKQSEIWEVKKADCSQKHNSYIDENKQKEEPKLSVFIFFLE